MKISNLVILQIIKLKGLATAAEVGAALGKDDPKLNQTLQNLVESGSITEARSRYRLTPEGKSQLSTLLEAERGLINDQAMNAVYEKFSLLNSKFKALASSWQIRDGEVNDHSDESYDDQILLQLADLHQQFIPVVKHATELAPRLAIYARRFDEALNKVESGDHSWFLRPIIDSYHTLWFELHEDLIGLTGRTRADEAAAGRAD